MERSAFVATDMDLRPGPQPQFRTPAVPPGGSRAREPRIRNAPRSAARDIRCRERWAFSREVDGRASGAVLPLAEAPSLGETSGHASAQQPPPVAASVFTRAQAAGHRARVEGLGRASVQLRRGDPQRPPSGGQRRVAPPVSPPGRIDHGERAGLTSEERARLLALEREHRELRPASSILESAATCFAAELDRPLEHVIRYVDAHRDAYGVEPICHPLQVAPSFFFAARTRPPSARAVSDEAFTGRHHRCPPRTSSGCTRSSRSGAPWAGWGSRSASTASPA